MWGTVGSVGTIGSAETAACRTVGVGKIVGSVGPWIV